MIKNLKGSQGKKERNLRDLPLVDFSAEALQARGK